MQTRLLRMKVGLWVLLCLNFSDGASAEDMVGVSDPERAEYNWVMHCRGCHGVDAEGSSGGAPGMAGQVSQFLHSQEGRAFLGRVPGVAFVALPDHEIAALLNWSLQTFDKKHIPPAFKPFTAEEVKRLRMNPLISKATVVRKGILNSLNERK